VTLSPTIATQSASASKRPQTVIDAGDYFFNPVQLTVSSGTTLTWRNVGGESHNAVARDGSFSSSSLMPGERFTFTFRKPGRYAYVCTFHEGDGMFAEITVE
jgi:plastocyanin